jgi:hypothetical protein
MEKIAFLGTRQPRLLPPHIVELYSTAAAIIGEQGDLLLSGATPGAEQLAAESALQAGGQVELFLPWSLYERDWVSRLERTYPGKVSTIVFDSAIHTEWLEAARAVLPGSSRLSTGSLAVHARCFGMLQHATLMIVMPYVRIAWQVIDRPGLFRRGRLAAITGRAQVRERTEDKGGAELAIRFAEGLGIAAYDLSTEEDRFRLAELLQPEGILEASAPAAG